MRIERERERDNEKIVCIERERKDGRYTHRENEKMVGIERER